jgi:integrase
VQQLKVVSGRRPFLAPPKTPQSRRTVELGAVVVQAVRRHIEAFPPVHVEIDDETNPRKPVRRLARLLFLTKAGNPIHRSHWSRGWVPAVEQAGMPKGIGFHTLRHYFATLLKMSDVAFGASFGGFWDHCAATARVFAGWSVCGVVSAGHAVA